MAALKGSVQASLTQPLQPQPSSLYCVSLAERLTQWRPSWFPMVAAFLVQLSKDYSRLSVHGSHSSATPPCYNLHSGRFFKILSSNLKKKDLQTSILSILAYLAWDRAVKTGLISWSLFILKRDLQLTQCYSHFQYRCEF